MSLSKGDEKQMRELLKTDEKKIDLFRQITDINIDHIGESIVVEISVNDLPESGLALSVTFGYYVNVNF